MTLLHGIALHRFKGLADDYLSGKLSIDQYAVRIETVLRQAEPNTPEVFGAATRFINRIEEIRFTLPEADQARVTQSEIAQFERLNDPTQLGILDEAIRLILLRILGAKSDLDEATQHQLASATMIDEEFSDQESVWRMVIQIGSGDVHDIATLSGSAAVADVLDSDNEVAGEIRTHGKLPTGINLELVWWGQTWPLCLPTPDRVLVQR